MANHIYYNGIIYPMNGQTASCIAVKDSLIEAVGCFEDLKALADPDCRFTDLKGNCVVPGFNDSHCHVLLTGLNRERLDLTGARSPEEIIRRGKAFLQERDLPEGAWIIGEGFDQNLFDTPAFPDSRILNEISRVHPVMAERICGHVGAANSLGLSLVGFDESTEIPGGVLDKDEEGRLTGVLREAALDTFKLRMPGIDLPSAKRAILTTIKEANAAGLTSMQSDDTDGVPAELILQAYQELENEGQLTVRIFEEIHAPRLPELRSFLKLGLRTGDGSDFFRIGNIKLITDGSLGARTASLRQDYSDDPGNKGIAVYTQEELDEIVLEAHSAGMQVAAHAIGDGAVLQCIRAFSKAWDSDHNDLRNRIVHCQFTDKTLLEEMAGNHIAADIQPPFVPSDYPLTGSRMGERESGGYVWKSMLDKGIFAGGGSDSPVESFSPIWGIHCAVNRTDNDLCPPGGWHPEQKLTVEEAVRLYTLGSAYLSFEENKKVTLEAGKLADFVVLDQNLFEIKPEKIKDTRVLMTVVGGKAVYTAAPFESSSRQRCASCKVLRAPRSRNANGILKNNNFIYHSQEENQWDSLKTAI